MLFFMTRKYYCVPTKTKQAKPTKLTVLLSLHNQLLTLHFALWVREGQPQPDGHEGPKTSQSVVGRSLDEFLCLEFLLVKNILVLDCQIVAVAAGHGVTKGLPLQRQLPGTDVDNFHILWSVDRICGEKNNKNK